MRIHITFFTGWSKSILYFMEKHEMYGESNECMSKKRLLELVRIGYCNIVRSVCRILLRFYLRFVESDCSISVIHYWYSFSDSIHGSPYRILTRLRPTCTLYFVFYIENGKPVGISDSQLFPISHFQYVLYVHSL